jgi:hypothetical protein
VQLPCCWAPHGVCILKQICTAQHSAARQFTAQHSTPSATTDRIFKRCTTRVAHTHTAQLAISRWRDVFSSGAGQHTASRRRAHQLACPTRHMVCWGSMWLLDLCRALAGHTVAAVGPAASLSTNCGCGLLTVEAITTSSFRLLYREQKGLQQQTQQQQHSGKTVAGQSATKLAAPLTISCIITYRLDSQQGTWCYIALYISLLGPVGSLLAVTQPLVLAKRL